MLRAAVRGLIDYQQTVLHDPYWWYRQRLLLNELAREEDLAALTEWYRRELTLFGNGKVDKDGSLELFDKLLYSRLPWLKRAETAATDAKSLFDLYKQVCGDPDDPAFAQAVQNTVEGLKRSGRENQSMDDEAIVAQRLRTRMRNQRGARSR